MKLNEVELKDCKDYVKAIPSESIDLILIDPPYNELPADWDNFKEWDYLKKEFNRILKRGGQLYTFGKQPMLAGLYGQLNELFEFRFELVWNKGKGMWASNLQPMRSHELIWCFKKKGVKVSEIYFDIESIKTPGEPYVRKNRAVSTVRNNWKANHTIYKDGRRFPLSVLTHPAVTRKDKLEGAAHPTQKPLEILKWIIRSSSKEGDTVLDCFMGSGSTAIAAMDLKRNYLGCEIDESFYKICKNRINKHSMQIKDGIL